MGNVLAILIGVICSIIGVVWTVHWWSEFAALLAGGIGITLFFGGLLALAIGVSELKASKEFEKMAPPNSPAPESSVKEESPSSEKTE